MAYEPVMRTPVALPPFSNGKERAMRRRFKQTISLQDRLLKFIASARAKAASMPDGKQRNEQLKKARQAETAAKIEEWANSPELQPPK
jgi:uncharacterized protein YaiL (DUF2058 family)